MWELLQITDFTVQSRKRGNYYKSRILQLILENVGTITNHGLYSSISKTWELLQITDFTVDP